MQGFIVSNYQDKFPEAIDQLTQWLSEEKLSYSETVVQGFENIPQAFIDLFDGKNTGKMIVKIWHKQKRKRRIVLLFFLSKYKNPMPISEEKINGFEL